MFYDFTTNNNPTSNASVYKHTYRAKIKKCACFENLNFLSRNTHEIPVDPLVDFSTLPIEFSWLPS